ncbi:MAG: exodeoxyribonuclease VII large subunit [Chitinophaga sp.]|uniref:exodeoxyribonuclease VII large subunit n=1 Tax=Chitinophaga sp. TaxID=1869181 RepID=UPI001B170E40|nr:exodeoxyribonuclease VII large subunit [Chitinophaga sp.]MBO9728809.1 exodeoxyribonuclease VII large subunit [Chitinophaga sp.]
MNDSPAIKLSALTSKIQQALHNVFAEQSYWVVADVTNHSFYQQKGYHYFDLVEKDTQAGGIVAKVAAVAWGNGATRIKEFEIVTGQPFKNDIHVLIRVSVSYHQVHGLQISLLDIDTSFTIGLLEQQKQQTLLRLTSECADFIRKVGDRYVTKNNQLPLRAVIQRLAVITSGNSAGYQDFRHTLEHNHFGYTFIIDNYFTVVQGEAKAELVQQRLIDIYNSQVPYDAVVIIRGGGAQTDFLIFDTFILGRAVAKFPIPVITGIGHQKNETITDMMAHTATKTPTKAAELIIAHNRGFEEALISMQQNIVIRSQQLFSGHFQELASLNSSIINQSRTLLANHKEELHHIKNTVLQHAAAATLNRHRELIATSNAVLQRPRIMVSNRLNDLDNMVDKFRSFSRMYIQSKRGQVAHYDTLFKLMSPANILKRGFAMIYQDGQVLSNASTLQPGSHITVVLPDASLDATITSKTTTHEPGTDI